MILSPPQHGFRAGLSCETQLVLAVDDWARSLDSGNRTDIAIFKFSKVFDSVPHKCLLVKLHSYGIRGGNLRWVESCLSCRLQRVMLNGTHLGVQ